MTEKSDGTKARWSEYHKKGAGRSPREFFMRSLRRFDSAGSAIDLGCGSGAESLFLLNKGWHVLAIDQQETAVQMLYSNVPSTTTDYLQTEISSFETVSLPNADFIWAGLSLPFCHPDYFDQLWQKIRGAINVNGRFAGNFFGKRHAWAKSPKMTFHTKEQILSFCDGLHLEYFIEEEGEQQTALDGIQHWHMFSICVLHAIDK